MVDGKEVPCCAICIGSKGAIEVDDNFPDLTGRVAVCSYHCGSEKPSSCDLPFFEYRGDNRSSDLDPDYLKNLQKEEKDICAEQWSLGRNGGILMEDESESSKKFTKESSDRIRQIHEIIRNSHTRDSYYCGCRGWD
jgi:hypothetical protein